MDSQLVPLFFILIGIVSIAIIPLTIYLIVYLILLIKQTIHNILEVRINVKKDGIPCKVKLGNMTYNITCGKRKCKSCKYIEHLDKNSVYNKCPLFKHKLYGFDDILIKTRFGEYIRCEGCLNGEIK